MTCTARQRATSHLYSLQCINNALGEDSRFLLSSDENTGALSRSFTSLFVLSARGLASI